LHAAQNRPAAALIAASRPAVTRRP
jgi:hypothetical protein